MQREITIIFYRETQKRFFGILIEEGMGILDKKDGEIVKFVRDFGNGTQIWYRQGAVEINNNHVIRIEYDR